MRDVQHQHHVCSVPSTNGVVSSEERVCPLPSSSPLPTSSLEPAFVSDESWDTAETTIQEIVFTIQPTLMADQKRKDIIEYVQRLIGYCTGCEVFPYGSVPLRTYLPDGDIDLSVFTFATADDGLVSDVYNVLRGEEHNEASHYNVKDVHCIHAEVKLVKCIVEDIVVDISFNQLGGLGTLCFLEQVDRLTGKDHLFKRSIILIKAWCYYKSRILGAHHGLISTYALETLVLYIFHQFHTSLKGPLCVLYTFLDYFSKFDWDNYCVSLKGPVCISSLPYITAELLKKEKDDLLLSENFLKSCQDMFSVSFDGFETTLRAFPLKHLNIIDPLRENNNLGRSVSRGNFYRIRSAFKLGARKLGWILLLPRERISVELKKFFANTVDGHGNNCWKNVLHSTQASGVKCPSYPSRPETFPEQKVFVEPAEAFGTQAIKVASDLKNKVKRHLLKEAASHVVPEFSCCLGEDVKRPEASGILHRRLKNGFTGYAAGNRFLRTLIPVRSYQAQHSYTFGKQNGNGKVDSWSPSDEELAEYSALIDEMSLDCPLEHKEKHFVFKDAVCSCIKHADIEFTDSIVLDDVANVSKNVDHIEKDVAGIFGSYQTFKFLLNLRGDYTSHFRNLQYGQSCHVYSMSPPTLCSPPLSPLSQSKKVREPVHESSAFVHHVKPQSNRCGVFTGPHCYPANSFSFPCAAFGEENKERHGTGTYFPNMICRPYQNTHFPETARNLALRGHVPLQRDTCNKGLEAAPPELSASAECRPEVEYPILGSGKPGSSDYYQSNLSVWESFHANSFHCPSQKLEHESPRPQKSCATPLPELDDGAFPRHGPASAPIASPTQNCRTFSNSDPERVKPQVYHLKNEDDFPPLSI